MIQRCATDQVARLHGTGARRRAVLCVGIAIALAGWSGASSAAAAAAAASASGPDASFDRNLLSGAGQNTTDLSRFERGNMVLPGNYSVDIYLNNGWVGRRDVRFAAAAPQASASPCVDRDLLRQLGLPAIKVSDALMAQLQDPAACVPIDDVIAGASLTFDMGELRLDASVPQAYLGQVPRGYVSPEYWDQGVPAALLNYTFNSYRSSSQGHSQQSSYLGLNAGFNLGAWHLRQDSTVNWQSAGAGSPARRQWHNIDSYVRRDLPSLGAQLTIGDSYTDGQVFDSFGLRGVQLATDDRMLADSLRGYAPVVRGSANSNAKVTVNQNGVEIYQTTVAPGPFVINDLYPTGYGGDLDVTVTEADGRSRTFSVSYASVAQLLRAGTTRFDIAAGRLRNPSLAHQPGVLQATVQRGFNNLLTGYAGLEGSSDYSALLLGSAINTPLGAFAFDVTSARTRFADQETFAGRSMRLSYSKILPTTQTSLTVAAYRYSTSNFLSLTDAAIALDYSRRGLDAGSYVGPSAATMINGVPLNTALTPAQQAALGGHADAAVVDATGLQRQRNRFELVLNQRLGTRGGALFANVSARDYWNRDATDTQFQLGYNNSFRRLTYSLSITRTRDPLGHNDNEYLASFNLPLGNAPRAPSLSLNLVRSGAGDLQEQAMINGAAGSDSQFDYGLTAAHSNGAAGNSGSLSGGYRSPYAVLNASYGAGRDYSQTSLTASGAVVAHPGGITFGQPIGDTVAIVQVPGAAGARLNNAAGARVDRFGYALVPYLTPYNLNTIQIDPKGLPLDVQLDATSAQVAPHAGAVVMLKFKTENGRTIIVRARRDDDQALPFGAEVFDEKGVALGLVGQAGQILVRGVGQAGRLTARWQDDAGTEQSCSFEYRLEPKSGRGKSEGYEEIPARCLGSGAVNLATGSGT